MWRSLVAHLFWEQRVAGSNPVIPTDQSRSDHMIRAAFSCPTTLSPNYYLRAAQIPGARLLSRRQVVPKETSQVRLTPRSR